MDCSGWNEECKSLPISAGEKATPKAQPLTSACMMNLLLPCVEASHKRQLHDTVSRPVEWCLTAKEEPGSKIKGPTHFDAGIKNGNPPGNRTKLSRVDTRYMCIHVKYMYMYTSQDE